MTATEEYNLLKKARALETLNKTDLALEAFVELISKGNVFKVESYSGLAGCYLQMSKTAKAINLLHEAIALYPKNDRLLFLMGYAYKMNENYTNSLKYFNLAIEQSPTAYNYRVQKASMLLDHKKLVEAHGILKVIQPEYPNDENLISAFCKYYFYKKDYKSLETCINKGLSLFPDSSHFLSVKARLHFIKEDYAQSLNYSEFALASNPNNEGAQEIRKAAQYNLDNPIAIGAIILIIIKVLIVVFRFSVN